jgi:lysophospholipase L1-like esterase
MYNWAMKLFWVGLLPVIVFIGGVAQFNRNETKELSIGGGEVLAVGDSIQYYMKEELERELGLKRIVLTHRAARGANSNKIYRFLKVSYRPHVHSVIIFDAGTNDDPRNPRELKNNLSRVAKLIGPDKCLITPTVNSLRKGNFRPAANKNKVIKDFAKKRNNVFAPNWSQFSLKNPQFMRDRLHPNTVGDVVRARMLTRSVVRCLNN